jgi:outer membrane protein assembly factor BamB
MVTRGQRQRTGRVTLWVIGGLVAVFVLLTVYKLFYADRFESDPQEMEKLEAASLPDQEPPTSLVGQWPQWRGPKRDGISAESDWQATWPPAGPPVLWKKKAEGRYSGVAVAKGRVFTLVREGDKEVAVCWDAETGKTRWTYPYEASYDSGAHRVADYSQGPRSTPTVDGDFVYTVGATGFLHCLRARDGKKVWAKDLLDEFQAIPSRWGVAFSPLVEGDLVFTNPGGSDSGSLAAFNKRDGKLKWKALDDRAGYSSPIAVTLDGVRQIVFFTRNGLVGVGPKDGKLYWRFPWETDHGCNIATPIARGNYFFISTNYGRGCAAIKVTKTKDGEFQAKRVYETNRMRNHYATSVLYKEHIYGFDEGKLVCLNFRKGTVLWKQGGFHKGSLLIANGHLIVLGENGQVAIAPATPDGFKPTAEFQVTRKKCWTMSVLAEGKLFVRDEEQVFCLDIRKK